MKITLFPIHTYSYTETVLLYEVYYYFSMAVQNIYIQEIAGKYSYRCIPIFSSSFASATVKEGTFFFTMANPKVKTTVGYCSKTETKNFTPQFSSYIVQVTGKQLQMGSKIKTFQNTSKNVQNINFKCFFISSKPHCLNYTGRYRYFFPLKINFPTLFKLKPVFP